MIQELNLLPVKRINFVAKLIMLSSLCACEPPVTFNEPQPSDTENLSKFPSRLQGQYVSLNDNSVLVIGDKLIRRIYDFDVKIHSSQLDSNSQLSGDTIIHLITNKREIVKIDGDSVLTHVHFVDTLFQMDHDNVVRKLKGYYFLNKRHDKESWEVKKIELSKGQLVVSTISTFEDIDKLKVITESVQDTAAPYKFETTKKQFKEFVKNEGFSDSETFVKQRK
jgi:hypothetical protein